jgi:hypothetical protein
MHLPDAQAWVGQPFLDVDGTVLGKVVSGVHDQVIIEVGGTDAAKKVRDRILNGGLKQVSVGAEGAVLSVCDESAITWKLAEHTLEAVPGVGDYDRTAQITKIDPPEADRRDFQALKAEALAGLTFPSMDQAEAFFGGLWTGMAINKTQNRGVARREQQKARNRLIHWFWAQFKIELMAAGLAYEHPLPVVRGEKPVNTLVLYASANASPVFSIARRLLFASNTERPEDLQNN